MYAQCLSESWLDATLAKLSDEEARTGATLARIGSCAADGTSVPQLVAARLAELVARGHARVLESCASSPAMPALAHALKRLLETPHADAPSAWGASPAPRPRAQLLHTGHKPHELSALLRELRAEAEAHVERALAELRALLADGFAATITDEGEGPGPADVAPPPGFGQNFFGAAAMPAQRGGLSQGGIFGATPAQPAQPGPQAGFTFPQSASGANCSAPAASSAAPGAQRQGGRPSQSAACASRWRNVQPAPLVPPKLCISCFPACAQLALAALERAIDRALDAARAACARALDAALDPASDSWLLFGWRPPAGGAAGSMVVRRAAARGQCEELEGAVVAACLLSLPDAAALAACLPTAAQLALAGDAAGGEDVAACERRLRDRCAQLRLARAKLLLAFEPALVATRMASARRPDSARRTGAGAADARDAAVSAEELEADEGLVSRALGELTLGTPSPGAGAAAPPFGSAAGASFSFSTAGPFHFGFT